MANVGAILDSAGASWSDVLKTTVFLAHLSDFERYNDVYSRFFLGDPPARTTVSCSFAGELIEIDAIALLRNSG
jgi:2-iminobutanoate/2-iminopropanoate deaminase